MDILTLEILHLRLIADTEYINKISEGIHQCSFEKIDINTLRENNNDVKRIRNVVRLITQTLEKLENHNKKLIEEREN